jgi:peptidyl-tRNA hydrolase
MSTIHAAEFFRWYAEAPVVVFDDEDVRPRQAERHRTRRGGHEGMLDYIEQKYIATNW